jgi:hypothetical protein
MVNVAQKSFFFFVILRVAESNYCLPTLCVQQIVNAGACFTRQHVQQVAGCFVQFFCVQSA